MAEFSGLSDLLSSKEFASEYLEDTSNNEPGGVSEQLTGTSSLQNGTTTGATSQVEVQMPEEKCRRHGNKTVEMYCEDHAVVGCIVCMLHPSHK